MKSNLLLLLLGSCFTLKVLFISDIHLEPFYSSTKDPDQDYCISYEEPSLFDDDLGEYRCDTNFNLVKRLFNLIAQAQEKPDLILIVGDSLGHTIPHMRSPLNFFERKNKQRLVQTLIRQLLQNNFPNLPVLNVLGNNDFITHYKIPSYLGAKEELNSLFTNESLSRTFYRWNDHFNPDFIATYYKGLFYSYTDKGIKFIVINTFYWNNRNTNLDEYFWKVNEDQYKFIDQELNSASRAIIVSHIPISKQVYKGKFTSNVTEVYVERVLAILEKHDDKIEAFISSHIHTFNYKVISIKDKKIPYLLIPSIAPIDFTNPAYALLEINENGIEDLLVKSFDLNQGLKMRKQMSLKTLLGNSITGSHIEDYVKRTTFGSIDIEVAMSRDADQVSDIFNQYILNNQGWDLYKCTMLFLRETEIQQCSDKVTK